MEKKEEIFSIEKFSRTRRKAKDQKPFLWSKVVFPVSAGFFLGLVYFIIYRSGIISLIVGSATIGILEMYIVVRKQLKTKARIRKIESVFPDFIEMMSSNLRAGISIDKALLMSSRKEFAPLDEEILTLGKEITTGREISAALIELGRRINSDKIYKTISVIISGLKSGGNLAILLEETATNMRERFVVEKRASSNVLMYIIFIFFASCVGAPILFSLSSVLVEVLSSILADIPSVKANVGLPLTLSSISVSVNFIIYFSVTFLIVTNIMASFLLGLVNKGEEKEGLRYVPFMIFLSLGIYFLMRVVLLKYFSDFIS